MDYGVVLNSFFWRRFKNKESITFFDPNEVPDLYEAFYKNTALFEELYVKYERRKDLRTKTMAAEDVFKGGILKERTDTGRIYLVFIDNVQSQGPFDPEFHTIYQSNLCCVTGDTEIEIQYEGTTVKINIADFTERWTMGFYGEDVLVKSWDGNQVVWQNISNAMLTKETDELVEIETESGQVIRCTPDHKIFTTNRGWVEAQNLEETDNLLIK
jgi:ribonucleotide reductase alpha subunit